MVAEPCVAGAVIAVRDGEPLGRPSPQSLAIGGVNRSGAESDEADGFDRRGIGPANIRSTAKLAGQIRAVLAGRQLGQPAHTLRVASQPEDRKLRLLGTKRARIERLQFSGQRLLAALAEQLEQPRLFPDVPIRIARTVMRKHRHSARFGPVAKTSARHRDQALHDRRTEHFEEKIFVGLLFAPQPLGFLFERAASAGRHQNRAAGRGLFEQPPQAQAAKRHAFEPDDVAHHFEIPGLARVYPRLPVGAVPRARPARQLLSALAQHRTARIAQQPVIFRIEDVDFRDRTGEIQPRG